MEIFRRCDLTTQWSRALPLCGVYFAPETKCQNLFRMVLEITAPSPRNM
jgi:hypothetical protein